MKLVIVERKKVTWFVCWALLVVISALAVTQWSALPRKWYGVKDGVMLEGRSMARLLPAEVKKVVTEMAKFYTLPPQNAGYFVETGEVIPDKEGRGVDIEATVGRDLDGSLAPSYDYFAIPAGWKDYFSRFRDGRSKSKPNINVAWGEEELPALLQILKSGGSHFLLTGPG